VLSRSSSSVVVGELEMVISLSTVKNLLLFCTVVLLALSFPIQVLTQSPYPSLLPYLLIGLIVLLPKTRRAIPLDRRENSSMNLMVNTYVFIVVLNAAWQTLFGVIRFDEGISAVVVYILPVVFYWYFLRVASEEEVRWSLSAMVVAGVIVGIYFAYDSYIKLALGQVSDFSQAAFEYSVNRAGGDTGDTNDARIAVGYRGFGLLESHSVSGAWIVIGALAALTFVPRSSRALRLAVILSFGTMVLLGLNFTAIIAFSIIVFVLEISSPRTARGRNVSIIGSLASVGLVAAILTGVALLALGDEMTEFIMKSFSFQTALALGTGDVDKSFVDLIVEHLREYYLHIATFPYSLLLGDGVSTFGIPKGSDIGLVETAAKLGLPYFMLLMICLGKLIATGLHKIKDAGGGRPSGDLTVLDRGSLFQFVVGVTLLVVIMDIHYSVWPAKSILPVVFFALALYGRNSSVSGQRSSLDRPEHRPDRSRDSGEVVKV
jgi:hypothetical protein